MHCNQWAWPPHKELSLEQISNLIRIFRSWNVRTLTLAGGNPLLYPYLVQVLEMARSAGIGVAIVTEGLRMPPDILRRIGELTSWIRFSLDGPTAEIHDDIRSSPGLFDAVVDCIQSLRPHADLRIGLNCVVQRRNVKHLSGVIDLAERLQVSGVFFKIAHGDDPHSRFLLSMADWAEFSAWLYHRRAIPASVETNVDELRSFIERSVDVDDAVQGRPIRAFYERLLVHCYVPLFFLTCDSEANAYPCDYLQADTRAWGGRYAVIRNEFRLGNILESPNEVLARAADLVRRRVHELPSSGYDECGNCTRFCQLNAGLTKIDTNLAAIYGSKDSLRDHIEALLGSKQVGIPFL